MLVKTSCLLFENDMGREENEGPDFVKSRLAVVLFSLAKAEALPILWKFAIKNASHTET